VNYAHEGQGDGGRLPQVIPDTGGDFVTINPGVTLELPDDFGLEASVNVPVYTRVEGTQIVGGEDFFVGFYKAF
jgi:hypothetical protein